MINLSFSKPQKTSKSIKPVVLVALDGFGEAPDSEGNAISTAKTPNLDSFRSNYPFKIIIASGESVGLSANEAGNSEVGHLNMGAGRTVYQSIIRISRSIEDESFNENAAFVAAFEHVKKNNSKLHILGLVSSGTVHSSMKHLNSLVSLCDINGLEDVNFHLFTDGRDAPPKDGLNVVSEFSERLAESRVGTIKTISGRFYAMDRDERWDRTKLVYEAMTMSRGQHFETAADALRSSYQKEETDEFVVPSVITGKNVSTVDDGDAMIFFNFRIDRPRQLTKAFVSKNVPFAREKVLRNIFFVTMTEYEKNLPVSAIAFPPLEIKDSLAEVLSRKGLKQLHLAESEKERMVCFYFDGLKDRRFVGEDVIIVPSPKVKTYDKKPQMSLKKIFKEFRKNLYRNYYHFFLMNFANPDLVAHSGNQKATVKAIEIVDKVLGQVVQETLAVGGVVFVTADHGNAEELITYQSKGFYFTTGKGEINTEHSNNPVPLFVIANDLRGAKFASNHKSGRQVSTSSLEDIAPTILARMGIAKPEAMTGEDLLEFIEKPAKTTGQSESSPS